MIGHDRSWPVMVLTTSTRILSNTRPFCNIWLKKRGGRCFFSTTRYGFAGAAWFAGKSGCQSPWRLPDLVIGREHPVIPVSVLLRRPDQIREPVQELKRREFDDAVGPRPRGLPPAARAVRRISTHVRDSEHSSAQRRRLSRMHAGARGGRIPSRRGRGRRCRRVLGRRLWACRGDAIGRTILHSERRTLRAAAPSIPETSRIATDGSGTGTGVCTPVPPPRFMA